MQAAKSGGAFAQFQTHTWPDADCTARSRGPRPPEKQVTWKPKAHGCELWASAKAEDTCVPGRCFQMKPETLAGAVLTEATWGDRRWAGPGRLSGGGSEQAHGRCRRAPRPPGSTAPFAYLPEPGRAPRPRGRQTRAGLARDPGSPAAGRRLRPSAAEAP